MIVSSFVRLFVSVCVCCVCAGGRACKLALFIWLMVHSFPRLFVRLFDMFGLVLLRCVW